MEAESEPDDLSRGALSVFFFSREEARAHVHVISADGEAKFWVEPDIQLAQNYRMNERDLRRVRLLIERREQEIRDAGSKHFER